jgi:hypothetical protein
MRAAFSITLDPLCNAIRRGAASGEVNYIVTRLLLAWLGDRPSYGKFNEAIGVLECAKLELYRRAVAPYEDDKAVTNGDVYR